MPIGGPYYKRHEDDEIFDRIEIKAEPRYKTSGMSGDEWRVGYTLKMWRKGHLLVDRWYTSLRYVMAALPWLHAILPAEGNEEENRRWSEFLKVEDGLCHQPGCGEKATRVYRLKELFSSDGHKLDPSDQPSWDTLTAFCERHAMRGDCGLEDADRNYELVGDALAVIEGTPPRFPAEDESPAVFGGSFEVSDPSEIPAKLKQVLEEAMGCEVEVGPPEEVPYDPSDGDGTGEWDGTPGEE